MFSAHLVVLLVRPAVAADDWPEFRGPDRQGHADVNNLPLRWGPKKNVTWRIEVDGQGWSSPSLAQGRLYLTAAVPILRTEPEPASEEADKPDWSLRALCFDAASGRKIWDKEVFLQPGAKAPRIHRKNSHASPTPLIDQDRLYVHFGHLGTACLTTAGETIWKRTISYKPVHGNGGSPALADGKLVFSVDGAVRRSVLALDAGTGKTIWEHDRPLDPKKHFSFSTPQVIDVNGQQQVISPGSDVVEGLDLQTGQSIWYLQYDGYSVIPRPVFAHGLVFLGTGYDRPKVLAIDPTGTGEVTNSHLRWSLTRGAPHTPSLLVVGQALYMVSDRGVASCVDALTGSVHWQKRLGGNYSASPVLADGRIYFQSEEGKATVIEPKTKYSQLAVNDLQERTLASYAVGDGAIFIRTAQALYRIEKK